MNFFCLFTVLVYPFHLSSFFLCFVFLFNVFHGQHAPNSVAYMHNFHVVVIVVVIVVVAVVVAVFSNSGRPWREGMFGSNWRTHQSPGKLVRTYRWAARTEPVDRLCARVLLSIVRRCITLQAGTSCKVSTWLRSKISRDIWQISCMIWNRARWKFWKKLDAASWFWEFLFRFSGEPAKCGRNGPSIHLRRRYSCSTDAKVLPARSSFEWAGEPTIWWQNYRARNIALWTH